MPTKTGIFTEQEYKQGHLFSYRLAEYIGEHFARKLPLYDYGCGPGTYLKYFHDIGFQHLTGIEGTIAEEYEVSKSLIINRDLTKPLDLKLNRGNVMCIEVGEHVPVEFEQVFIENVCEHAIKGGLLILSWAHEGQQGYGHVNCRPEWYVIEEFHKRGFIHIPNRTQDLRNRIEGHVAYLKENLFVFHKA